MTTQSESIALQPGAGKQAAVKVMRRGEWGWRVLIWVILVGGACVMLLPFLWLVSSSVKEELAIFRYPPQWIPDPFKFSNYVEMWTARPFLVYLRNSLLLVLINEVAVLGSASLVAYGFARIDFPGRNFWFGVVIATMMLPGIVLLVPTFIIFTRLQWVDTFLPLTVPAFFGGGAFNIFLLRQFFRSIPADLADAARIDGCNEFGIYSRIMLPLAKPALATIAVFVFIGVWNDFTGPLLYLSKSQEKFTVALGLATFQTQFRTRWDLLMAASTAMLLPIVLIFFFAQRFFIQGIVTTGIKG